MLSENTTQYAQINKRLFEIRKQIHEALMNDDLDLYVKLRPQLDEILVTNQNLFEWRGNG